MLGSVPDQWPVLHPASMQEQFIYCLSSPSGLPWVSAIVLRPPAYLRALPMAYKSMHSVYTHQEARVYTQVTKYLSDEWVDGWMSS